MSRRAFTLIEVLVSLAIFALAAVGLGAAYSNVLLGRVALKEHSIGIDDIARARAAMLETINFANLEIGGDIYLPDERMAKWKASALPTTVSDLFLVTLTVEMQTERGGAFGPPHVETQYLLRPTWSVEADRKKLQSDAAARLLKERGYDETTGGGTSYISSPSKKKDAANTGGKNTGNNNGTKNGANNNNNKPKENNPAKPIQ